jgi:hypothetical protein
VAIDISKSSGNENQSQQYRRRAAGDNTIFTIYPTKCSGKIIDLNEINACAEHFEAGLLRGGC